MGKILACMTLSESTIFRKVAKALGIIVLGLISVFIPVIGPILFLISLVFAGRLMYFAWLESEREFAVTNRESVPNVIFDPKRSIVQGYEDDDSATQEYGKK